LRVAEDISIEEVRELACDLTYKSALFGLNRGGAKACINIPASLMKDKRRSYLDLAELINS
jgi:glutamate dehydrogenase/leucine dehydrogenase